MTRALPRLLGLSPRAGPEEVAAAAAAGVAVVAGAGGPVRPEGARRAVAGPQAYAAALAAALGGRVVAGRAFGAPWPMVEIAAGVAGPGLPVVAGAAWREGPDGAYRLAGGAVEREGPSGTAMLWAPGPASGGRPPDVVLFEAAARWLVRDGAVEVEDAFSRVEACPAGDRLERLLHRLGLPREAAARLAAAASPGAASVTVWREAALVAPSWREPERLLGAREGVSAAAGPARVILTTPRGTAEFAVVPHGDGWSARRLRGWYPAVRAAAWLEGGRVAYRWEVSGELDPLEETVRLRLAFDLASDLVVLGPPTS